MKRQNPSEAEVQKTMSFTSIDGCVEENHMKHHTDDYESKALIVRRGQPFNIVLNTDSDPTNCSFDDVTVSLQSGTSNKRSRNIIINIPLYSDQEEDERCFKVIEKQGKQVKLSVYISKDTIVSKYSLSVKYSHKNAQGKRKYQEIQYNQDVFILFNPWCKADDVYMEDVNLRNEYVLNDSGMVYMNNMRARPWLFGQFTDVVFRCTVGLLETTSKYRRDNVREVARHLSAMANSFDNNGVLEGNWSGEYEGGTKPWQWNGSVKIFEKYRETKESVKFGQCWVFSGIITSMMRAMGIPCRSVTNYSSAHDTDNNCTFDKYYDEEMNYLEDESDDSCWNFHVWNDVWMARPDLPAGMGGWQAVDGTPQEESKGVYRCGPASLQAIKEGNVHYNYDTKFVFAEVNADTVFWRKPKNEGEKPEPVRIKSNSVGRDMSTKQPTSRWRQDVTIDYKYPEGSLLERAAVRNAMSKTRNPALPEVSKDVKFSSKVPYDTDCNSGVDLHVKGENTTAKPLTVSVVVTAQLVRYTGVTLKKMSRKTNEQVIPANGAHDFNFHYDATEYVDELDEDVTVRMSYMARVIETKQIYVNQKICTIKKPDVKLSLVDPKQSNVKAGDEVHITVVVPNICGIKKFTKCFLNMEGSILAKEIQKPIADMVVPNEGTTIQASFVVKDQLKTSKSYELIVSFDCAQISGINSDMEFHVQQ